MLYMMFPLRQHCLCDKGDGQKSFNKNQARGKVSGAHAHTCA